MNYLAHTFLSFTEGQIVGNLIEDFVKNSERLDYPEEIQKGIILHRAIDNFTDMHPEISKAKKVFQPAVRLYSGVFVDIAMDYFLANDEKIKSKYEWKKHSEMVYKALWKYKMWLPKRFEKILPKMESGDWLYNYREDWAMELSLNSIKKRAKYLENDADVFTIFLENKDQLQQHYEVFFPDLWSFTNNLAAELD